MSSPRNLSRLGRFAIVGGGGFVIDATILTVLVNGFGWTPYTARSVSFAAAVTATWYANRRWVFGATSSARTEYGRYFFCQIVGSAINLGVYAVVTANFESLAKVPVIPLTIGAAVAMIFNFFASTHVVFRSSLEARR